MSRRAIVTGAFSYTGSAVARELLRRGWTVHTLTRRRPPPGAEAITSAPLRFELEDLVRALDGADALVNTYWIRLPHGGQSFDSAVENSRLLVQAAKQARVGRLVQVSVSNANPQSELGYYRGKGQVDEAVRSSGLSHAIARPTLIVGPEDVLTANIAWLLRHFPLFPVPDGGGFRLQPVTLSDTGRIIADAVEARDDMELDVAGPEVMSFLDYVRLVAKSCGLRRWVVSAPSWLAMLGLRLLKPLLRDVVLTREELDGLVRENLVSKQPALGVESVKTWLLEHGCDIGRRYVNDRRRHFGAGASEPILSPYLSSERTQRKPTSL